MPAEPINPNPNVATSPSPLAEEAVPMINQSTTPVIDASVTAVNVVPVVVGQRQVHANDDDHHDHQYHFEFDDYDNGVEHHDEDDDEDDEHIEGITFVDYRDESQLDSVMALVGQDLSEPYSIFTYRFFLHRYPELCILAVPTSSSSNAASNTNNDSTTTTTTSSGAEEQSSVQFLDPIGCVVGKIDTEDVILDGEPAQVLTGYIGMLAVNEKYRRKGIGRALVRRVLKRMRRMQCTSVTLETEVSNQVAQSLYQDTFGFLREELLVRYYLNWSDAYRLRLWFT